MDNRITILNVTGPFREPRDPIFSYEYSIQRPTWPTSHGIRIKVSIQEELNFLKENVLGVTEGGTPGQQLIMNRVLSRHIADQKFNIVDQEGMLSERLDVLIEPFTGPFQHLFPKLEAWMRVWAF